MQLYVDSSVNGPDCYAVICLVNRHCWYFMVLNILILRRRNLYRPYNCIMFIKFLQAVESINRSVT